MAFFVILLLFLLFFLFYFRPYWGLFLAVFLAPFLGLTLDFSRFEWAQNFPYLNSIDAPVADFVALFLFGVVVFSAILRGVKRRSNPLHSRDCFPRKCGVAISFQESGFFYFLPFLLVGALSLFNIPYDQFSASLKYLLRPILFFYLIWVLLPVVLIDSEQILERVIKIVFWIGVLAALMGLVSLFISPSIFGFWRRAAPLEFFGLAPLAYNHNLLAEVLVAAAPLGFWLFVATGARRGVLQYTPAIKRFYFFGFIFITTIALLTFARAAWLALAVQAAVYWSLRRSLPTLQGTAEAIPRVKRRDRFAEFIPIKSGLAMTLFLLPLLIYMTLFSLSPIVRSSNATRLDLTGIAWTYFKLHPWQGNGAGTFLPLVEQTRLFTVEYGDPLDAHGVIQKIMAEQGLLGLFAFFIFVGWIIHRLYRGIRLADDKHHLLLLCLFLSVAGSLVYQLFNTSYYNAHLWLPVGVALAGTKILIKRY